MLSVRVQPSLEEALLDLAYKWRCTRSQVAERIIARGLQGLEQDTDPILMRLSDSLMRLSKRQQAELLVMISALEQHLAADDGR